MSRYHLTSTSRALYRVFIAPNVGLARVSHIPLQYAPAFQRAPFLPITSVRTKVGPRRGVKRQAISDLYVFDNAIDADQIDLIDLNGNITRNIHIDQAFRKFNRITHHLLLVTEAQEAEYDENDVEIEPAKIPVCKIISKIDLRMQYNRKIEVKQKAERGPSLKNLELNWAIAGGDLKHRLEKFKGFLREGKKVEVMLGPKRKGRKASDEEANSVLKAVEDAARDCRGAGEMKRNGALGGVMTLTFQGTKLKEDKPKEEETKEETEEKAIESEV